MARPCTELMDRAAGLLTAARRSTIGVVEAWWRESAGVAAVEFALILPVMVAMFLGMSEVTLAVSVNRKLTLLSRSLADLSSRNPSLTTSDVSNNFGAASVIMQPYSTTTLQMIVSSIGVTQPVANGPFVGAVDWSCAKGTGANARAANSSYTVPAGFQIKDSHFMLVEVTLPYSPLFGRAITGTINLSETTPWPIRNAASVTGPGTCPA